MTFYEGDAISGRLSRQHFRRRTRLLEPHKRTGYKVIRVIVKDGVPTGEYEDFATGFVVNDAEVWGRPVGVAVDKDGALVGVRRRQRHDLAHPLFGQGCQAH